VTSKSQVRSSPGSSKLTHSWVSAGTCLLDVDTAL
jgi:hypothetical protein